MSYTLYIVRCADGTLYTGIATAVARQVAFLEGADRFDLRAQRDLVATGDEQRKTTGGRSRFLVPNSS